MGRETLWFIVGRHGLYVGGHRTRRTAIAAHVNAIDEVCYRLQHSTWGELSSEQRRAWKDCRKKGDRPVKAIVTWPEGGASDAG